MKIARPRLAEFRVRHGFTLVLTLLVSTLFVTFLLAAFTRMKVETQVQGNVTLQEEAKQQALQALGEALQSLQLHAGKDQRVTAEASAVISDSLSHPRWIGVWSTESGASLRGTAPQVWLVSSAESTSPFDPQEPLDSEDSVVLLRDGLEEEDHVRAPLVTDAHPIEARGLETRHAWWVADEGMKLRLFTGDSHRLRSNVRVPTHFAFHTLDGLQGLVPWHPEGEKVLRVSQVSFLSAAGKQNAMTAALKRRFHDITTHSLSVLSNPHRGGLKTDLSAKFSQSSDEFDHWRESIRASSPWMHRHAGALRAYHFYGERARWVEGKRVLACQPYLAVGYEDGEAERLASAQRWVEMAQSQDEVPFEEPKLTPEWMGHAFEWQIVWSPKQASFELQVSARFRLWNPYHAALRAEGFQFKTALPPMQATFLHRRKWQGGHPYLPGDEVWYRGALYVCIKTPKTQTPQSSGYWQKLTRKWSKAQRREIPKLERNWRCVDEQAGIVLPAGAIVDFVMAEEDSTLRVADQASDTGATFALSTWKPEAGVDANFECAVVLEPLPMSSTEYELNSPHSWQQDYGLPATQEQTQETLKLEQSLLWGVAPEAWFTTKRMKLPRVSFETLAAVGQGRGLTMEITDAAWRDHPQPWPLGILAFQFSALDEAPLIRGPKNVERQFRNVDPRAFTNFSLREDSSADPMAVNVEVIWLECQQGKKRFRLSELANLGRPEKSLYDLPAAPIVALGQWQHYPFQQAPGSPAYAFANSYEYATSGKEKSATHRLHEELWDEYFFTGLDQHAESLSYYQPRSSHSSQNSAAHVGSIPEHQLYLKGGFNVNSTRVEAWKGFLNSVLHAPLLEAEEDGSFRTTTPVQVAFPRHSHTSMGGGRSLSPKQVAALAEAMVEQIRQRGPFRSVSAFLNSPTETTGTTREGTLEAALSQAQLWYDPKTLQADGRNSQPQVLRWGNANLSPALTKWDKLPKDKLMGSDQLLQAGDLLQVLSPYLMARSDTFKIRAYGEVRERSTGKRLARAWCEALVQRFPDYVAPQKDLPQVDPAQLKDPLNRKYGRKFEVLHLKWLAPDEI